MNAVGLAIFVKTPGLSPVKSRLAADIGQRCAEAFHLAAAEAVASVVVQARDQGGLAAYWAVAEAEALEGEVWSDLPRLAQGEGALGERMARVHERLLQRHHAALLIGADAPQLSADRLGQAARWLLADVPRQVIGRAHDGGFWLFGSNVALPTADWTRVPYSSAGTAQAFVAAMRRHGAWLEIDPLADVDTFADFAPVHDALVALAAPTEPQRRLAVWMHEVIAREGVCP